MRKLVAITQLTRDGVMQAPGGPEEDRSGGFEHGGWSVNYWDEIMEKAMGESMSAPFELVLGRKTYEIFAAHWPHAEEEGAELFNDAVKHVGSRTLENLDWSNSRLIGGDVPAGVAELKAQDGPELQVLGSAGLLQTLLAHELVDELRLWIFPVVVGKGKRLFGDGTVPSGLKLVSSTTSTTGVIIATFEPAGPIEAGSFALEEPTEQELERRESLSERA